MPRFVAKPTIVEAIQYDGHMSLMPESFRLTLRRHLADGTVEIMTGDGARACKYGDWIVHGPDGLFSVMRNATFEAMFTPHVVQEPTPQPAPAVPATKSRSKANG